MKTLVTLALTLMGVLSAPAYATDLARPLLG